MRQPHWGWKKEWKCRVGRVQSAGKRWTLHDKEEKDRCIF